MKAYRLLFILLIPLLLGCSKNRSRNVIQPIADSLGGSSCQQDSGINNFIYIEWDSIVDLWISRLNNTQDIMEINKRLSNTYKIQYLLRENTVDSLNNHYFWIQVGYDDGYRFVVLENYDIFPDKKSIYRYDPLYDTLIKIDW